MEEPSVSCGYHHTPIRQFIQIKGHHAVEAIKRSVVALDLPEEVGLRSIDIEALVVCAHKHVAVRRDQKADRQFLLIAAMVGHAVVFHLPFGIFEHSLVGRQNPFVSLFVSGYGLNPVFHHHSVRTDDVKHLECLRMGIEYIDSPVGTYPYVAVVGHIYSSYVVVATPGLRIAAVEVANRNAVETVEAVFGAEPYESVGILRYGLHITCGKPLVASDLSEGIVLPCLRFSQSENEAGRYIQQISVYLPQHIFFQLFITFE